MRYALSKTELEIIQPILPTKSRGVSRVDDRRVLKFHCQHQPTNRNTRTSAFSATRRLPTSSSGQQVVSSSTQMTR